MSDESKSGGDGKKPMSKEALEAARAKWTSKEIDYASVEYWDNRYAERGTTFEWLQSWRRLAPVIQLVVCPESYMINLGCALPLDMWEAGFPNMLSVDYSEVAVKQMEAKAAEVEGKYDELTFAVMDVTKLDSADETFDVVIDKSTMDALACTDGGAASPMRKMLQEGYRVLKPGGVFVCISFGTPPLRLPVFKRCGCPWETTVLRKVCRISMSAAVTDKLKMTNPDMYHYIYFLFKPGTGAKLSPKAAALLDEGREKAAEAAAEAEARTARLKAEAEAAAKAKAAAAVAAAAAALE